MSTFTRLGLMAGALFMSTAASAATLNISVTTEQASDGVFLTPFFFAFHDGTYDTFNEGQSASQGVETLAETGSPATQIMNAPDGVTTAVAANPEGFAGAPVIDPGETATVRVELDPTQDIFLSFLSMVIPSNDAFIGNDNPLAYQLFKDGVFSGLDTIRVYGGDVWDAGTEDNTNIGAAFNLAGGDSDDTIDGVISRFGTLDIFLGQSTVAGTTIGSVPGQSDLLATITISPVPLPASSLLLLTGLAGVAAFGRRKARTA